MWGVVVMKRSCSGPTRLMSLRQNPQIKSAQRSAGWSRALLYCCCCSSSERASLTRSGRTGHTTQVPVSGTFTHGHRPAAICLLNPPRPPNRKNTRLAGVEPFRPAPSLPTTFDCRRIRRSDGCTWSAGSRQYMHGNEWRLGLDTFTDTNFGPGPADHTHRTGSRTRRVRRGR